MGYMGHQSPRMQLDSSQPRDLSKDSNGGEAWAADGTFRKREVGKRESEEVHEIHVQNRYLTDTYGVSCYQTSPHPILA